MSVVNIYIYIYIYIYLYIFIYLFIYYYFFNLFFIFLIYFLFFLFFSRDPNRNQGRGRGRGRGPKVGTHLSHPRLDSKALPLIGSHQRENSRNHDRGNLRSQNRKPMIQILNVNSKCSSNKYTNRWNSGIG